MEELENILVGVWTVTVFFTGAAIISKCLVFFFQIAKYHKYFFLKKDDREEPVTYESLEDFLGNTMKQGEHAPLNAMVSACLISYIAYGLEMTAARVIVFIVSLSILAYSVYADKQFKKIKKFIEENPNPYEQLNEQTQKDWKFYVESLRTKYQEEQKR